MKPQRFHQNAGDVGSSSFSRRTSSEMTGLWRCERINQQNGDIASYWRHRSNDQSTDNRSNQELHQSINPWNTPSSSPPRIEVLNLNEESFPTLASAASLSRDGRESETRNEHGRPKSPENLRHHVTGVARAGKSQTVDFSALLASQKKPAAVHGLHGNIIAPMSGKKSTTLATANPKGNALDSTAPSRLRGKEKSLVRIKKPSTLRRVLMRSRQKEDTASTVQSLDHVHLHEPHSDDPVYNSQPLTSDASGVEAVSAVEPATNVPPRRPDRMFYCPHPPSAEMAALAGDILDKLVFYQDRAYHQDPKLYKRRFVCGFKDVAKHIDTKEVKLIFLATDLERVDGPGGITDQLDKIRETAEAFNVPVVFVMKRRMLARKCRKPHVVSIVGLYNYDVAATEVKRLLNLVEEPRVDAELVSLERDGSSDKTPEVDKESE